MVAYNFKPQFAPLIASGQKCQTIRALGKRRHARAGDTLQLYTGQRTRSCRKLLDTVCTDAISIVMHPHKMGEVVTGLSIYLGHAECALDAASVDALAKADGFESISEFVDFFRERLPFEGVLIQWRPPSKVRES
ncbi:ASCH domain-containing protein [Phormidium sp. FACHB-1136]|uniref:ASCH domain-containing protein n=1 Tax=Phormidium sp. FACHB-1136 TaxID=2692848 RepID=UPI0016868C16|nr:ASCH domain-containing protein [Phormidium sp. FACHB-1136]MBD2429218.1 ASCH domain-containing protein [Phormidium sp. FACHB-1136]